MHSCGIERLPEGRPDEFMFRQFQRHSKVLRTPARYDYFMLSGGANLFPVSDVWKELLDLEIRSDLAYGWYTSQAGVPALQRAVSMWENYAASCGNFPEQKPLGSNVCMTLGASQAVTAVFDYIANVNRCNNVIFVGLNYPLFERLARHYRFNIYELIGEGDRIVPTLPPVDELIHLMQKIRNVLVVVVTPNNPSGEQYSSKEIELILREAENTNSIILLDQVGQLHMTQAPWVNIEALITQTCSQDKVVVVNSFSKSDGVPGFRLGYMIGHKEIIQHASQCQLITMMNAPTVPIIPPFFSLIARCFYVGEQNNWVITDAREKLLNFARHMFEITTAIAPKSLLKEMNRRLSPERFNREYERYSVWQTDIGLSICKNYDYVLEKLNKYLTRKTNLHSGFNFLVELQPFENKDEDEVCRRLFENSAVAILTESCFRVSRRRRNNFWIRMSLAAPCDKFSRAVDNLAKFLSKE